MVNRVLIRIKTIQLVYSYYVGGKSNLISAEKDLFVSLDKSYELYHYLLYLIVSLRNYAEQRIERGLNKHLPTLEELHPNTKFINNTFARQLAINYSLLDYVDSHHLSWNDDFVKNMLEKIVASDLYKEYMESSTSTYEDDKTFWRKIMKLIVFPDDDLSAQLEEESLYWNDDLEIISTFILKTIKRFTKEAGGKQLLLERYKDDEDPEFGRILFCNAITKEAEYRELIHSSIQNWDMDRIAFMDIVIMQVALSEILNFPSIPINVTFNEYLEIAKMYSTEKSSTFINGVLDSIIIKLKKENKLLKD